MPKRKPPIFLTPTGQITINNEIIELDEIGKSLKAAKGEDYSAYIHVRGGHDADMQSVLNIASRVQAAGFSNLGLLIDAPRAQ